MRVLLLTAPAPAAPFASAIGALAPDIACVEWRRDLGDAELAGIDAALGWRMPPGLAARLPRLQWLCATAAGVDKLLVPGLAPGVVVSRIVDPEQAAGVAQFVVAIALRHARELDRYVAQQHARDWTRYPVALAAPRAVVLGTGATGGTIVDWLGRVGFRADGWNRRSAQTLNEAVGDADLVVCALPLTAATENLLDAAAFAAMKQGAYFVNVARGEHVVEADLIDAVASGRLSGAALDVQRREPMPADDPLWSQPGIAITPHIAGQPRPEAIAAQFVAAARALQRGEPVPNAVDRSRGY